MNFDEAKEIFSKAELPDDEKQKAFEAALASHVDNEAKGLKAKNAELIAAEAKLKASLKDTEAKLPEWEGKYSQLEARLKEANPEEVRKALEAEYKNKLTPLEAKTKELEAQNAELVRYREAVSFQSVYKKAITKEGQELAFIPGGDVHFARGIKSSCDWKLATVKADDGSDIWINDKGQTLEAFINEYRNSAEGKALIASGNAGGGSTGSKAGAATGAKTLTRIQFDALPQAEKTEFFKKGGLLKD